MGQEFCEEPTKLIANGWFLYQPEKFIVPDNCTPLFISLHLTPELGASYGSALPLREFIAKNGGFHEVLKRYEPIGARDVATQLVLEEAGIECYVSGRLTLTLELQREISRGDTVMLTDVPVEVYARVRGCTSRPILALTHATEGLDTVEDRMARAAELLNLYQGAHLVITSRLHAAMPCLALGTPVILVGDHLEGPRFTGLESLTTSMTVEQFLNRVDSRTIEHPEPNRPDYLSYRKSMLQRVRQFVDGPVSIPMRPVERDQTAWLVASHLWAKLDDRKRSLQLLEAENVGLANRVQELERENAALAERRKYWSLAPIVYAPRGLSRFLRGKR